MPTILPVPIGQRLSTALRGLATAAGLCAFTLPACAEDWPRWRGIGFDGISKEKNWAQTWPDEGLKQLWKQKVGVGFSSMAVASGVVYTMGNKDETDSVFCLDAETGKVIWNYSYPCAAEPIYYEGGPGATPTVDGDKVYTLSKLGHLFCFDARDGRMLWTRNLIQELSIPKPRWGFSGSPTVLGKLVIVNVGQGGTALDKENGNLIWGARKQLTGYSSPIPMTYAAGKTNILTFGANSLNAVRLIDGSPVWSFPWATKWDINAADPIVVGSKIFISTFDRGCALLETENRTGEPKVLWQNKEMANHFNSCVILGNTIYGMNGNSDSPDRDFRALDLATGMVQWKYEGLGLGSLMAADNKLIVLSDKGELLIVHADPSEFKPLARTQVLGGKAWTTPVLAHGRIYCRNAAGDLVCVDVRKNL